MKREDIGHAAVAYMAEMMDMHESDSDQEQNQIARHLAQFGARCFAEGLKRAEGDALKVSRKGLAQHNYDPRRVIDTATGVPLKGPQGWGIWHCVRCGCDSSKVKGRMWYRTTRDGEWFKGPFGCGQSERTKREGV
ncbi:MAG TPA: hypothetical protein VL563_15130 [Gemmatimonadales bacterium]|jgi:hypothetical protein|nr:hypothetical protein [Gemmatimonadales bacterium]